MLISANIQDLTKAAKEAARLADPKAEALVMRNLLLTARAGKVTFTGSGLAGSMSATVVAEVAKPGSAAVDGRVAKLLGGLPPDGTAKITGANDAVTLTCGRSRYRVDALPADQFPPALTAGESPAGITLSAADCRRLFELPAFAISRDRTRNSLCGLSLKSAGGRLVACGANGSQLIRTSVAATSEVSEIVIPHEACELIAALGACTITASNCIVQACTDTRCLVHKLIDGVFPPYERVIPAPSGISVEVDRVDLIAALKRVLVAATTEKAMTKVAALEWRDGELSMSLTKQPDIAADVLKVATCGSGKTAIAVEPFIGLLGALEGERVLLDTAAPSTAVRITLPGDDDLVGIQMPCVI